MHSNGFVIKTFKVTSITVIFGRLPLTIAAGWTSFISRAGYPHGLLAVCEIRGKGVHIVVYKCKQGNAQTTQKCIKCPRGAAPSRRWRQRGGQSAVSGRRARPDVTPGSIYI